MYESVKAYRLNIYVLPITYVNMYVDIISYMSTYLLTYMFNSVSIYMRYMYVYTPDFTYKSSYMNTYMRHCSHILDIHANIYDIYTLYVHICYIHVPYTTVAYGSCNVHPSYQFLAFWPFHSGVKWRHATARHVDSFHNVPPTGIITVGLKFECKIYTKNITQIKT